MTRVAEAERVVRHRLLDRLYHWTMAAAVLTLLGTGFLPILGWKFEWVTAHWIAGLVLAALVIMHIVRASVWLDFWSMVPAYEDVRSGWRTISRELGRRGLPPLKPGKYSLLQKLYHLAITGIVLALIASGLLMLLKIDTPWWRRNPYFLADDTWGLIYVVHDFAAMALVTLVMIHIYFAVRPDEWWASRAMFRGWITRREYEAHCDRTRWQADDA